MIIARVLKHGSSYGVIVPKPLLSLLGWVAGDMIALELVDGRLTCEKLDLVKARIERRGKRGRGSAAQAQT